MLNLIDVLFGCRHKSCSFPITRKPGERRSGMAAVTGTYRVCLDCGREFAYDWHTMEVVDANQSRMETTEFSHRKLTSNAS